MPRGSTTGGHGVVRRPRPRRQPRPSRFELIAGGRSNLTYRVTDGAGRAYALRRPPLSHVLPTAHDMAREYRVITALGPTAVPVPATFGLCEDEAVNGAPFYVMEFVDGHILRDAATAETAFDVGARTRIGDRPGRHPGRAARRRRRRRGARRPRPPRRVHRAPAAALVRAVPPAWQVEGSTTAASSRRSTTGWRPPSPPRSGRAVVHGDYRLDNIVLGDDGAVRAVLDWEICTLGDPLADVGLLMVYWTDPGDDAPALLGGAATTVPGFSRAGRGPGRATRTASGRDVAEIDFYVAFGYWKLACILQGVYARYVGGAGAGDADSVEEFPPPGRPAGRGWPADRLLEATVSARGAGPALRDRHGSRSSTTRSWWSPSRAGWTPGSGRRRGRRARWRTRRPSWWSPSTATTSSTSGPAGRWPASSTA